MISQEKIEEMIEAMPAFSGSVTRIMELTADINCAPRDLVEVIDHDPVMTVKILKLVNSAYFGLRQEILSIKQGVVILGINTVKNLAITIAAVGMMPRNSIAGFDSQDFLLHSLGTATIARILSQRIGISNKESTDFFVAGLLHDFGKVVLVQSMPEKMQEALSKAANEEMDLCAAEMEIVGTTHADLGAMLARKWKLPETLARSIEEHHNSSEANEDLPMRDCVIAANLLSKRLEFGHSGNPHNTEFPKPVEERFGGNLEKLLSELGDLSGELDKTRAFAAA